jgi:hypothetical protein
MERERRGVEGRRGKKKKKKGWRAGKRSERKRG